jgi:DoxX-like family
MPSRTKGHIFTGRILTGAAVVFMAVDAGMKVFGLKAAVDATVQLGFPQSAVFTIGVVALVCVVVYLIPRTAVIGAILWTGCLGGATAIDMRAGAPLFSNTLFPVYFAVLLWAGLWLRDSRVDALFADTSITAMKEIGVR